MKKGDFVNFMGDYPRNLTCGPHSTKVPPQKIYVGKFGHIKGKLILHVVVGSEKDTDRNDRLAS